MDRIQIATQIVTALIVEPQWLDSDGAGSSGAVQRFTEDFPEGSLTDAQRFAKAALSLADAILAEAAHPIPVPVPSPVIIVEPEPVHVFEEAEHTVLHTEDSSLNPTRFPSAWLDDAVSQTADAQ